MFGFRRLQTRLTVLYAALFGAVLTVMAIALQIGLTANAQSTVVAELSSSGAVFQRVWALHVDRLQEGAQLLAQDFGFRQAMATGDPTTANSALENLKTRLKVDAAMVMRTDGSVIAADGDMGFDPKALLSVLDPQEPASGMLTLNGRPYLAIAAPVLAPDPQGWVIFASKVDREELAGLERTASIPVHAEIVGKGMASGPLLKLVIGALKDRAPPAATLGAGDAKALVLVRPLAALGGAPSSALVLSFPLVKAMAPYRRLSALLFGFGLVGAALLVAGGWLVARGVTRPVKALDEAAHRLQRGEAADLVIPGRDEIARLAESFNVMARTIQEREAHITEMAHRDVESGLANRRALERQVAILRKDTGPTVAVAVAVFGIDRLAAVRGVIGHELAQSLIAAVARRLAELGDGEVSRLTTGTLALAFEAPDFAHVHARLESLVQAMRTSIPIAGTVVDVTLTCGYAFSRPDEKTEALIGRASVALDQAAASHRRVAEFDAAAYGDPAGDLSLMSDLMRCIGSTSLTLAYQPKYDLRKGRVTGVEALARWRHPERGFIPPDRFIVMAEETGHIREMTDWSLFQALADQRLLAGAGLPLDMSVNLSGRLLADDAFIDTVIDQARGRVAPLWLEITETAVIDDPARAMFNIAKLAAADILISIDDYGSGLSSLSYLRDLRAHELKIDKAFVLSLDSAASDALLVRSTIDLGHSLGLKVTAEGVETAAAQALLAGMGCDLAQGYHIARPMAVADLQAFLQGNAQPAAVEARRAG